MMIERLVSSRLDPHPPKDSPWHVMIDLFFFFLLWVRLERVEREEVWNVERCANSCDAIVL